MGLVKDSASGGFINAAALHTYKTVFYNVEKSYTVLAAKLIKGRNKLYSSHFLAVNRCRNALFKMNGNIGGLIGRHFGGNAHLKEAFLIILGLVLGVLKVKTLVGQVPDVLIL